MRRNQLRTTNAVDALIRPKVKSPERVRRLIVDNVPGGLPWL